MKIIEKSEATAGLGDYAGEVADGPVIVTNVGQPLAVLLPIENADLETIALSTDRRFLELIERSRSRVAARGQPVAVSLRRALRPETRPRVGTDKIIR